MSVRARARMYAPLSTQICAPRMKTKLNEKKKTPNTQKCSMRTIVRTDRMEQEKGKQNTQAK